MQGFDKGGSRCKHTLRHFKKTNDDVLGAESAIFYGSPPPTTRTFARNSLQEETKILHFSLSAADREKEAGV